jgi:hypothetical protein
MNATPIQMLTTDEPPPSGPSRIRHMQALAINGSARVTRAALFIGAQSDLSHFPIRRGVTMRLRQREFLVCLAYAATGFAPIAALALTLVGLWPLSVGALVLIVPAVVGAVVLGVAFPKHGRVAAEGLLAGLAAVLAYDIVRWTFVGLGWWGDFIPNIGGWLNGTGEPNWMLGYGFRWLGDGGGMGVTFMVCARQFLGIVNRPASVAAGIAYGVVIWACLLITLIVSPEGQSLLFVITPVTLLVSWIGHVIYGSVLGAALVWFDRARDTRASAREAEQDRSTIEGHAGQSTISEVCSSVSGCDSRVSWPGCAGATR